MKVRLSSGTHYSAYSTKRSTWTVSVGLPLGILCRRGWLWLFWSGHDCWSSGTSLHPSSQRVSHQPQSCSILRRNRRCSYPLLARGVMCHSGRNWAGSCWSHSSQERQCDRRWSWSWLCGLRLGLSLLANYHSYRSANQTKWSITQ